MPVAGDRLALFAMGALLFGITLQTGFVLVDLLRRYLADLVTRRATVIPMVDRKELYGYE
jgi:hypothetical protein